MNYNFISLLVTVLLSLLLMVMHQACKISFGLDGASWHFFTEAWATMIWTTTYAITSGPWDIHIRSVVSWRKGWPNLESRNQTIRNWSIHPDLVVDDHFSLFSWHIFWGIPWYTSCISPGSPEVLLSTDMRNDSTKAVIPTCLPPQKSRLFVEVSDGGFHKWYPRAGWFIWKNSRFHGWFGGTPISGNL